MSEQDAASAGQQALYPSPPPFYKLYREDADGSAERPFPPAPPAPVTADYQMFGEIHTIEPGNPPLQGSPLFAIQPDGNVNFRQELLQMNQEVLFSFHELLTTLVNQPSRWHQQVENIGTLLRQMQHLLNMLRAHQARATLAATLQAEIKQRLDAVTDLKLQMSAAAGLLAALPQESSMEAVDRQGDTQMPDG